MKNRAYTIARQSLSLLSIVMIPFGPILSQGFQRTYGTTFNNSFTKVIQDGANYYVLGQDEPSSGATLHATVTRLDGNGIHQWTLSLDIGSVWNDAVLTPSGDLMVVGATLPFDGTNKSLIGLVTPAGGGNFTWVRSYDVAGRENLAKIVRNPVPQNAAFPYYILGSQWDPSNGSAIWDDIILMNIDAGGTFNWKKIFNGTTDDEFGRDLEVAANGDLMLAGNLGSQGVFILMDNAGTLITAGTPSGISFSYADLAQESGGGFYAVGSTFPAFQAHIMKYDNNTFPVWEATIAGLTGIRQVWEDSNTGGIYVTGTGLFNGKSRGVLLHFVDGGNQPNLQWVKYLDDGETSYQGGSTTLLFSNQISFVDGRIPSSGGFGLLCAFMSVSNIDIATCITSEDFVDVSTTSYLYNGPIIPSLEFFDFPTGTDLVSSALNWQQQEICASDPCQADFSITPLDACGHIQVTNTSTGVLPLTYLWCDGSSSENLNVQLPCGLHTFCLTITDANGCTSSYEEDVTITDNIPPIARCALPVGVTLDANCTYTLTPAQIDGGSSDNCQIQSLSVSPAILTGCGIFPVTLTVTDWCGNTSTCTTEIQTGEDIPPVISCPSNVVDTASTSSLCSLIVNNLQPLNVSDNCSTPDVTFTVTGATTASGQGNASGLAFNEGVSTVIYTATDDCGNTASCSFTVTIVCLMAPVECCLEWAKSMGGPLPHTGQAISVDALGNVFTAGVFWGNGDFDPGPNTFNLTSAGNRDIYVTKFDPAGNFIWAISLGGQGYEFGYSIANDVSGNTYLTGVFENTVDFDPGTNTYNLTSNGNADAFLIKLDPSGNLVWAAKMGGNSADLGNSIALDVAGDVYMAGSFLGAVDFDPGASVFNMTSAGSNDIFITKISSAGNFMWAKQIGGAATDLVNTIAIDLSGNILLGGIFNGSADFDPGSGVFNLSASSPDPDMYVSKLDASGNFLWAGVMPGTSNSNISDVAVDVLGDIFTTGTLQGTSDFDPGAGTAILTSTSLYTIFISKLNSGGGFLWAHQIGGASTGQGYATAIDVHGDLYATGAFQGSVDFDPGPGTFTLSSGNTISAFIQKSDNDGNFIWAKQIEGQSGEVSNGIFVDANGSIYTTGNFIGAADFYPGANTYPLSSTGNNANAFVSKLSMCPQLDTCQCGSFTDMAIRFERGPGQSVVCGGPPVTLSCPPSGHTYALTGKFQCQGSGCPEDVPFDSQLELPDGTILNLGTQLATPFFAIPISSLNLQQTGVYTMTLTGHCGTNTCSCIITFLVETPCIDECETLDIVEHILLVQKGFAQMHSSESCEVCFSPIGLPECDTVTWFLDGTIVTPIGTSLGKNTFCYTFPASGEYIVIMQATYKAFKETLDRPTLLTCQAPGDCSNSVIDNATFSEGAIAGGFNSEGSSEGWDAIFGDPVVIEGEIGSTDGWTIELSGNIDTADVLSRLKRICLEGRKGTFSTSVKATRTTKDTAIASRRMKFYLERGWSFPPTFYKLNECNGIDCYELASIELPLLDSGEWVNLVIPYDLSNWDVTDTCGGLSVRPIIYITNSFSIDQGGEQTFSYAQLDNFCFNGTLVAVEEPVQKQSIRIYPNPTSGDLIIQFTEAIPKDGTVQIVDLYGRLLLQEKLITGVSSHTISMDAFSTGIYFVKITERGLPVWIEKVIKQ